MSATTPADLAKTKKELIAELEAIRTENAELKNIDAKRKLAEEELQKANKLLRTILENLRAIVFMRDIQGRYVFINPWYERLYDLKNEDIIGNTPFDFLPPETAERLLQEDRRIIASGEPLTHEEMVPSGDTPLHFLTTKVALYDDQGFPYAVCGIATDITKQKLMEEELRQSKGELTARVLQATQRLRWSNTNLRREIPRRERIEANLRESEERFRGHFELGLVGMGITGSDQKWLEVNEYLCDLLGYSRQELLAKSWSEITHPDDLPMNLVFWDVMVEGKTPGYQMEKRFICKDGGTIVANVSVRSVRDEEGKLKYNMALVEDITERKSAEERLRASEAMLKEAQSVAHVGHWEVDIATERLLWSDEVCNIFGIKPEEFKSSQDAFFSFVHPEDKDFILAAYGDHLQNRVPYSIDHRIIRPDGEVRVVHEQCQTHFDPEGVPVRSIGTVQDITERKLAEQTLSLILEGTSPLVGKNFFHALVSHLANGLGVRYVLVGELLECRERVRTLAVWEDGKPGENMEYALHDTPCDSTIGGRDECHFPEHVTKRFPEDKMLADMGAESYLGTALRDSEGRIIGVLAIIHDTPTHNLAHQAKAILKTFGARAGAELERKRADEALQNSERKYRTLFDSVNDIIQIYDLEGKFIDVNQACCTALGYSKEELLSMSVLDVDTPESGKKVKERMRHLKKKGKLFFEVDHVNRDGSVWTKEMSSRMIHYDDKLVAFCVGRDITERKQAEEKLRLSEQRLKRLSSKLISAQENERRRIGKELHDSLGQLLAFTKISIETCVQRFVKKLTPEELKSLTRLVPHIQQTIGELRRIIMDLRPTILDDMGIIATIVWFCRETQEGHGEITFTPIIAIEEHNVPEDLKIVIFRIMQEAVNNAVKHGSPNNVTISLQRIREEVVLTVDDNGKGFDLKKLPPPKNKGGGLGLISMEERSEFVGGTFEITSSTGGTKIEVKFPHAHEQ
jgi:PAS domain S-box-containing protein